MCDNLPLSACAQRSALILPTGLAACYDVQGLPISCPGSGQDADRCGIVPLEPRFLPTDQGPIIDRLTRLIWYPQANALDFPLSFAEALEAVKNMNQSMALGRSDWRVPTRPELRSILSHEQKNPALPVGHPFSHVFLGRYWTSTAFAGLSNHAWYVHLEGARVFYERKDRYCLVWPVAGTSSILQIEKDWSHGDKVVPQINCKAPQGGLQEHSRFVPQDQQIILDQHTGLSWLSHPLAGTQGTNIASWSEALSWVVDLSQSTGLAWRLPDINELESLVDLAQAFPALSVGHPFTDLGDGFWSSTTSGYDPAWAYVLYLGKGAVGVGFKANIDFLVWPVLRPSA